MFHFILYISLFFLTFLNNSTDQLTKTILFVGDSFTAGDGVEKAKTFPGLIGQDLKEVETINQGRSGWPTSAYLRRWDEVEKSFPKKADIVFIQLGANDLRVDGHSKQTVAKCAENMETIVKRIEKVFPNSKIVLMSSVKIDHTNMVSAIKEAGFGKQSNKYLRQIGKAYKKLAKEKGYDYLDLIAQLLANNTHDGAHLSEKGHTIVAKVISDYLKGQTGF